MNIKKFVSNTINIRETCALIALVFFVAFPAHAQQTATRESRGAETAIDAGIADDAKVAAVIAPYRAKVLALNNVIGTLDRDAEKRGLGGGEIGNFVADAIRVEASKMLKRPIVLAVTNNGGLRKNRVTAGEIRVSDIYELLPFENALVTVDLTGEQLTRLFQTLVAARDAQSGAVVTYRTKDDTKTEFASAELIQPSKKRRTQNTTNIKTVRIKPNAVYTIVTSDYLVNRGGDYAMLKEGVNVRPLNLTLRDAVLDYVRAETAAKRQIKSQLDNRFRREGSNPNDKNDGENK